jgi:lipopolysaccharide export system ATP-binding protein
MPLFFRWKIICCISPTEIGSTPANGSSNKINLHKRAKLGLGYLPQEPSVFRKLSVADNIMAVLELNQALDKATQKNRLIHKNGHKYLALHGNYGR